MSKEINKHSQNSSVANVEVAKVHTALKRCAEDTVEKPNEMVSEILANVSQVTPGSLPNASAMRKTIKCKSLFFKKLCFKKKKKRSLINYFYLFLSLNVL